MKAVTKGFIVVAASIMLTGVSFAGGPQQKTSGIHLGANDSAPNVFLEFQESVERSTGLLKDREREVFEAVRAERAKKTFSPQLTYKRKLAIEKAKERRGK